ncbi:MAG TPA: Rieske (2Fe-2S) protein [Longimicrobiales bacterium]|nr:Rieske (2Fe-2S) protein [Longimicrobiales bacterium]
MRTLPRREFLALGACAVGCAALGGCASTMTLPVTSDDGRIRVRLDELEGLSGSDGFVRLSPGGAAAPIYLLTLSDGSHAALSPICTHLGCTVDVAGQRLVCPCHGSTYARDGTVLRGPAERPLRRYRVTEATNGELVIHLEEGA